MTQKEIMQHGMHRLDRPRWNIYQPDGLGRDYYIGYNNGGFWDKKLSSPYVFSHNKYTPQYHTLYHRAAPFRYLCDGTGRDNYIIVNDGGLRDEFRPLKTYSLRDFLRKDNNNNVRQYRCKSKGEIAENRKNRLLEKELVNRLYPFKPKKKKLNYKYGI